MTHVVLARHTLQCNLTDDSMRRYSILSVPIKYTHEIFISSCGYSNIIIIIIISTMKLHMLVKKHLSTTPPYYYAN